MKLLLCLWLAYTATSFWCPCASASGPLCAASALVQRFVHTALHTIVAPPLLTWGWLTNRAGLPHGSLARWLHWLACSSCEPDRLLAVPPARTEDDSFYLYFYWGVHFPATTRCWHRLFVSNAPLYLENDPNKPDDLVCEQLVLIKRFMCAVTGCSME